MERFETRDVSCYADQVERIIPLVRIVFPAHSLKIEVYGEGKYRGVVFTDLAENVGRDFSDAISASWYFLGIRAGLEAK